MPTPRPDTSVTWAAVENPGWNIRLNTSLSDSCRYWNDAVVDRFGQDASTIQPGAVIADFHYDVPGLMCGPRV